MRVLFASPAGLPASLFGERETTITAEYENSRGEEEDDDPAAKERQKRQKRT